jgi:hypothetical protein
MSREASRERARTVAEAVARLNDSLADPALLGYPIAVLCNPLQRPALPCAGASGAAAAAVEARSSSNYKE